jgi:hypothetical protein
MEGIKNRNAGKVIQDRGKDGQCEQTIAILLENQPGQEQVIGEEGADKAEEGHIGQAEGASDKAED